ncbi:MAG: carbohydrate kinase [Rhodoluna sp.]|nr:carbohydrate kinase [Rhodoluna sp.]
MILVIGEALIDLIENRYQPGAFTAIVGGANLNVATALARRNANHTFYARMSSDRFGQIIRAKLDANNVNYQNSIITNENSTLAIVSLNEAGVPTYSFYVNGTSDWGWTKEELPTQEQLDKEQINCIQFGRLTMAMEPGNLVIENWARELKNVTISHDINIRAALGFDPNKEKERVERTNKFSNIIKASDEDIEWLYQNKRNVDVVAQEWAKDGKIILITRGADGVSIFRNDERMDVPSRKINVVDTVGAGDTFCANLLGQLQDNKYLGKDLNQIPSEELKNFVYISGIAASITCERAGCEPPTQEDLKAVLASL